MRGSPSCASRARILPPTSGNTTGTHSRIRIRVENTIRRTTIFRIAKEKYRNDRRKYDRIIHDMVCGVVNQTILLKRSGTLRKAEAGRPRTGAA